MTRRLRPHLQLSHQPPEWNARPTRQLAPAQEEFSPAEYRSSATSHSVPELLIDGEIKGDVTSTGTLTVGEHARITGDINVGSITVNGTIQGNVTASEKCTLAAGATLRGDIAAPRLAVDENATFSGSCRITAKRT